MRITTKEITRSRSVIRREKRVAHEGERAHGVNAVVGDHISHASWRVAWSVYGLRMQTAHLETIIVYQEPVELAAIACEFSLGVEGLAEHVLHCGDVAANRQLPPTFSCK